MSQDVPARLNVIAVLIATTAALITRSWLQLTLRDAGYDRYVASDLSYLVVPPVLLLLLFPVLRKDLRFIKARFRPTDLSLRIVLAAIAIGLLVRVAWWSQLIARIAFGFIANNDPNAVVGPAFSYECSPVLIVALGILVASVLIPVIEEVTFRGYLQSFLLPKGPIIALVISTSLFMLFHQSSGWGFAFVGGSLLGIMYWQTQSLWASTIMHAVVNLTPQFTWRCMSFRWNPTDESVPLVSLGILAAAIFFISAAAIIYFILRMRRGTWPRRRPG